MYSIVNIALIILAYQCIIVLCAKEVNLTEWDPEIYNAIQYAKLSNGTNDCYVNPIKVNFEVMPIIFMRNGTSPYIIHPDVNGHYHFLHGSTFSMSCMGNHFVAPSRVQTREITIKCLNGFLFYKERPQILTHFQCSTTPHSKLVLTNATCQGKLENRIIVVAFVTSAGNIPVYKMCFDTKGKNTLYSWMFVDAPVNKYRQVTKKRHRIMLTSNYGRVYPPKSYDNQTRTLEKILDSKFLSVQYIKKHLGKHFLTPCYLTPRNVFPYILEQDSTNYYENTVPMWIEFNRHAWRDLEFMFRKNMIRGETEHLIVTGSYGLVSFNDAYGEEQPYYLHLPLKLKVPLYVWKMYFDMKSGNGTVFIGLNNPYKEINANVFFCKTMRCPGHLSRRNLKIDLIFCCSLKSFEQVYGKIDRVVYEKFDANK